MTNQANKLSRVSWLVNGIVAERKGSAPLIKELAPGYDLEPGSSLSHLL
jgi:hypothetical protein